MGTVENEIEQSRKALSRNLKRLRKEKFISQEKLALDANVDRTVVSKIEREATNPSIEILIRLAFYLGVHVTSLFDC